MPSTSKTELIQLNQYLGNEYQKRTDINEDNLKIDNKFKEINTEITNARKGKATLKEKIDDIDTSLSENTQNISNLNINKADKGSPTELSLPFVNSIVNVGSYKNTYYKNQFNEVTIVARYQKSGASDDIVNGLVIFTLPIGYRPTSDIAINGKAEVSSGMLLADAMIKTDGTVLIYTPASVPYKIGQFNITFRGGN